MVSVIEEMEKLKTRRMKCVRTAQKQVRKQLHSLLVCGKE